MNTIFTEDAPLNTLNFTTNPEHIDRKHWEEWQSSGVSEKIISQNVLSVTDPRILDKILDRNTKRKWKHSYGLVPCWQVSGIDPFTEERTLLGVQVKPDVSVVDANGKVQKYIGASGYGACPLFLDTGVEGYWKSIIEDKSKSVIIGEGAKKAGAGLSIDKPTISIPGVSTCRKKGRLHAWINALAGFGRTFYLCFDNDVMQKKPVQEALLSMARELCATGSKVMVIELPPGPLKGMDDFIANNGAEEFEKLIENAKTIEEWKQTLDETLQQQQDFEDKNSKIARFIDIVRNGWGDSLRMNELKNCVELQGQPLDINQVRLRIALEFDVDMPIWDSQAIVEMLANENAYSPVAEYLDNLSEQYPDIDTTILDDLATRYFGSSEPLHNIYMKKMLVAAVARVKRPGCKHDCAAILVGKQGAYKSTFWKELFGVEWFTDELGDANERDELMKLHRFWCLEWSEFETVYKRKDVSALKKFMTSTVDAFRSPYGRTVKEYPRRSVLVGTTNEQEILSDPTGSRRFWIIPVTQEIPIQLVSQERDRLWAAANALFETGFQWWLTPEETEVQELSNQEFQVIDPWTNQIRDFIRGREFVTVPEVLASLSIEPGRQDVATAKRVSAVLRRLGCKQARRRVNGDPLRVWTTDPEFEKSLGELSGSPGSAGSVAQNLPVNSHETTPSCSQESKIVENASKQVDHPLGYTQHEIQPMFFGGDPGDPLNLPNFLSDNGQNVSATLLNNKPLTSKEKEEQQESNNEHLPVFEIGQMVRVLAGPQRGNKLEILDVGDRFLKLKFGENDIRVAVGDVMSLPPALPEPELFTLGTGKQRKRKVDCQSLVGKRVKIKALGELAEVVGLSTSPERPLIWQSVEIPGRKGFAALEDLE